MLIAFIAAYLLGSIAIGLFAARRVHSTADYAVAGRSLPLYMVVATTFATWFGSELVLGFRPSSCKRAWAVWWKTPSVLACAWCWSGCSLLISSTKRT